MRFAGMALDAGKYINAGKQGGNSMDSIIAKANPDYTGLSGAAGRLRSQEKVNQFDAQAMVQNSAMNSLATTKASAFGAQSTIAQGEAAASATQAAGFGNMIGGLAGGIGGLASSRSAKGAEGIGKASTAGWGNYPTYNSKQAAAGANSIGSATW